MMDLSKLLPTIGAGIFALISAYFAWRLKKQTDEKALEFSRENEKREEIKDLYLTVFELFEKTSSEIVKIERNIPQNEFHRTHARVHLLASDKVAKLYDDTCAALQDWMVLYFKASPERRKVGDSYMEIYQAPDPTAQYKEPAQDAHKTYQSTFNKLAEQMKSELK